MWRLLFCCILHLALTARGTQMLYSVNKAAASVCGGAKEADGDRKREREGGERW